jgi:SAM-dependent methyltransferase
MSYQSVQHAIATKQNIELIRKFIQVGERKVVDIGCNEGLVSYALAMSGYDVIGMEANQNFANLAEQRSTDKLKYGSFSVIKSPLTFDNLNILDGAATILLLSVHHQFVSALGLSEGNRLLEQVFQRAQYQFFFQPACIYEKYGCQMPFIENDYASIEDYFVNFFAGFRKFRVRSIGLTDNRLPAREPLRPLMLFEFGDTRRYYRVPSCPRDWEEYKSDLVHIPTNRCVSNFWYRFGEDGNQPMRSQVKQLLNYKGEMNLEDTVLYKHFKNFAPETYGAAAKIRLGESLPAPLGNQSTRKYFPLRDEALKSTKDWGQALLTSRDIPEWDQNLIGPVSDQKVLSEIQRLTELIRSLSKEGYSPYLFKDGFIRGYFLVHHDEWAFLVSAGMHRLAVMAHLGYTYVQARLQPTSPSLLDTRDQSLPRDLRSYLESFFKIRATIQ